MTKYDHRKIEKKWQERWAKDKLYATPENPKKKHYVLDMFPYPSGAGLHVGHPEGYTATDIYSRYMRMNGHDVLHPMGWDAFGLPAENYAIKEGIHPAKTTATNIKRFREQIQSLGLSYDWEREVNTSDPQYYKWTQWLFLKFYEKGLAYRKEAKVNWCPKDQTVLANEQVVNGKCERCGSEVTQKLLPQWFLKITNYADELLSSLDKIDWPEPIKLMQQNWIGRSEGAEIDFSIADPGAKRLVLLHGKGGSPRSNFLPGLKKELEARGYEVEAPQMPGADEPDDVEQRDYVLEHCQFDENTTVLGHSFGGLVALRVLETGVKVNRVILVGAPFSGKYLDGKSRPTVTAAIRRGFDFDKIKKNARSFTALYDTHDNVIPTSEGEAFAEKLSANLVKVEAKEPHFSSVDEPTVSVLCSSSIKVFTTRPDTVFGATYMVLAPEHPLVPELGARISNLGEVKKYIEQAKKKTELQRTALEKVKTGVELRGVKAINTATNEEIPIWIADYVLMGYGTGAIMAVPAHDERDFAFAKKYDLQIREVVAGGDTKKEAYTQDGILINSGKYDDLNSVVARKKITKDLGKARVQYKLRDWLISRQRYWGAPIPVVHCEDCGIQPVAEAELPVELPTDVDFRPTGESPLVRSKTFHDGVKCPNCKRPARRDTDTMDTFVDSSWYWIRYTDPLNAKVFADKKEIEKWTPVDTYVGGAEHAVLHLLYSRFFCKVLRDLGYLKFDEPFLKLRNQGLILGPDGQKMSKSKGNVINPDDVVDEFGADSMRMYEMFMGPLEDTKPWSTDGIKGIRRFLEKVWRLFEATGEGTVSAASHGAREASLKKEIESLLHKTIKKVQEDIEAFKFNTAISALMIFANELSAGSDSVRKPNIETFLKILAPFAPHLAEELWDKLGHERSIHLESWPEYDDKLVKEDTLKVAVQVNGKHRGTVEVASGASESQVKKLASEDENVKRHLGGKKPKKVIYVKGKIINFVM
ncbi:MAG: hypothetical protein A3H71_00030 [Candidatus Sungbacteria bacterium RIFCSPLOWO2_02_FULL_48_13b]|uniref:Leucine--tRNA ligase n=1 Tax=Candidatus Sungbacteria bacterium RIFCSPLOWO2_02_FULL_48_13b TaxID=1802283 RepID=A0A1G2LGX8_9BACT|nr:MAG: hypothetical protein A3H71_00030 [Candidatus Sungbacteria bacterium RIFCSPLOWO2_02_FULL_48_13b]